MTRIGGSQIGAANGIFIPTEVVRAIVASTAQGMFETSLRAVVLTGSLARNEGTFIEDQGSFKLLGDCDVFLLFHDSSALPSSEEVSRFDQEAMKALADAGISGIVGSSAIHSDYLQKLEPNIFSYELRTNADVLCGDQECLKLIPSFGPEQIPLEDAWRMLCNRMVECLEHMPALLDGQPLSMNGAQSVAKLYLDMTTSLLVFLRKYRPSYKERLQQLELIAQEQPSLVPFSADEFLQRVNKFTNWKLSPRTAIPADVEALRAAIAYAHLLYRFELETLTSTKGQASDSVLGERWAKKQPLAKRLRGWAFVARACSHSDFPAPRLRWLALSLRRSPRELVYECGAELFFRLPCVLNGRRDEDWSRLRKKLPVSNTEGGSWSDLARDVVWNYKNFLVGTRA
jgi:hypothetical protein